MDAPLSALEGDAVNLGFCFPHVKYRRIELSLTAPGAGP